MLSGNMPRLETQMGTDNITSGYGASTINNNQGVLQSIGDVHELARREKNEKSGSYSDLTRKELGEHQELPIHPLDKKLLSEYPNIHIRKSLEVESLRQSKSPILFGYHLMPQILKVEMVSRNIAHSMLDI
jgi:hypothetical protein